MFTSLPITRKHLLILVVAAIIAVVAPYAHLYHELGYQSPKFPVATYADGDYYFDRMKEVDDGYPLLGNPYFIEHREELPPAFFFADWLGAIPTLLGAPLMVAHSINFFVWSLIFLVLTYLIFRQIDVVPRISLLGTLFIYFEVFALMIRAVSMQIVFPFFLLFLLAFILWLKDSTNSKKIFFLALSSSIIAYIYTYAWQIVIVTLGLVPVVFFFTDRKKLLVPFFKMAGIFVLTSLPLILFTFQQVHNPFYWETMERIGLVNTHLPALAVITSCIWIPAVFCFWFLFLRKNKEFGLRAEHGVPFLFFVLTGFAMVIVTLSNVITGKDLELPQHIERFIIPWLGFVTIYTLQFFLQKRPEIKFTYVRVATGALLIALIFFGNARYFLTYGPSVIFYDRNVRLDRQIQGFDKAFQWLRENVKDPAVVWADPRGPLNRYLTMTTPHYELFNAGGLLQLVSNAEIEERYLVAHYFALHLSDLETNYEAYGGAGNAFHQWKTHNRKVKICRLLQLNRLGYTCGELTDRVSWKGKSYFEGLYDAYQNDVQPNIVEKLRKYHVSYIIRDNETDSQAFRPETIPGTKLVYTDGRFFIYGFELQNE